MWLCVVCVCNTFPACVLVCQRTTAALGLILSLLLSPVMCVYQRFDFFCVFLRVWGWLAWSKWVTGGTITIWRRKQWMCLWQLRIKHGFAYRKMHCKTLTSLTKQNKKHKHCDKRGVYDDLLQIQCKFNSCICSFFYSSLA